MKGEEHQRYRQALVRAIDAEAPTTLQPTLARIIGDELQAYAAAPPPLPEAASRYREALSNIASAQLIQVFFGAPYPSTPFQDLMREFHALGPDGVEWFIGQRERHQFRVLRDRLTGHVRDLQQTGGHWMEASIIGRMARNQDLDETSLGNLIYMVEMGRFDMACLFRWISKYAASHPELRERLIAEEDEQVTARGSLHLAFIRETLRMDQIERLVRTVNRDVVFQGYLIPRFSAVRLCLWESHKAADTFTDPFRFNPDRFLNHTYTQCDFAPFGLLHHSCPFGNLVLRVSTLFLRTLVKGYALEPVGDGPPVRARYHWQPPKDFTVRLHSFEETRPPVG